MEKQYKIPFDMFRNAFIAFQKKFVYPKSYAIMGVLAVVIGIYAYFIVYGGENVNRGLYCMIILFCLMMMAFQWINPRKIRMKLMEGVREIEDDEYRLRIFPEYLEIGTILPPEDAKAAETDDLFDDVPEEDFSGTRIHYNKGLNVVEYPAFFMIYQQKWKPCSIRSSRSMWRTRCMTASSRMPCPLSSPVRCRMCVTV